MLAKCGQQDKAHGRASPRGPAGIAHPAGEHPDLGAEAEKSSCLEGRAALGNGGEEGHSGAERVSHHTGVKSHSSSREKKSPPPTLNSPWSGCLAKSPFRTRNS